MTQWYIAPRERCGLVRMRCHAPAYLSPDCCASTSAIIAAPTHGDGDDATPCRHGDSHSGRDGVSGDGEEHSEVITCASVDSTFMTKPLVAKDAGRYRWKRLL